MNASIDQSCAQGSIWGVKSPRLTFTPQVMTSGAFFTSSRCINHTSIMCVWVNEVMKTHSIACTLEPSSAINLMV